MGVWLLFLVLFISFLPSLKPDFDFEKFFPLGDPDLTFYKKHVEIFDYDNDYITAVLVAKDSIFDPAFLQKVDSLAQRLRNIENVENVASPTDMQEVVKTPMGSIGVPLLHIYDPGKLKNEGGKFVRHPIFKSFVGRSKHALLIHIQHTHVESIADSDTLLINIQRAIKGLDFQETKLIGRLPAQQTFIGLIQQDFTLFLIIALSLSFVLLRIIFTHWKGAIIPFIVSISTLIGTLGLMAMTHTPISILGALIAPIILFTSTSDCVHLLNAYHQTSTLQHHEKLLEAVKKVFIPTLLTSVTTAIGFLSLMTMPIEPLKDFGLFSAVGVLFAFLFTMTVVPLFIHGSGSVKKLISANWLAHTLLQRKKIIYAFFGLMILLSIYGTSLLSVDAQLLADLPEENKISQNFNYLDKEFGGSKPWEVAIWTSSNQTVWNYGVAQEIDKITTYISDSLPVARVWSPVSLIKYGNQIVNYGDYDHFLFPDLKGFQKSKQEIFKIYASIPQPKIIGKDNTYGRITGFIPQLGSEETEKFNKKLQEYIANNIDESLLQAKITGTTALIDKTHSLISYSMVQGLLIAVILVSFILWVYFQSLKIALISLIPNILPLIFSAGIMGIFGISLNLTTSIIFAIAFGIAVDDTIHFISSYQLQVATGNQKLSNTLRSTGNGMTLTTLIVLVGFIVFLFSSFGATFYLGLFLVLALSSALITDLTLLPLLLSHFNKDE